MNSVLVGTNLFIDCETPLAIDHVPVIQIAENGDGSLHLSMEVKSPPARQPVLVRANTALSHATAVTADRDSIEVRVSGQSVLQARRVGEVVHLRIDLRPVGLFVYSDDRALHVGTSRLEGNTMTKAKTGIMLATGPQ